MATSILPISVDLLQYAYSHTPQNVSTSPTTLISARNVLYLPLATLRSLQIKPGSWVPLTISHQQLNPTNYPNVNENLISPSQNSLQNDILYSPELSTVAQIQIYQPYYHNELHMFGDKLSTIMKSNSTDINSLNTFDDIYLFNRNINQYTSHAREKNHNNPKNNDINDDHKDYPINIMNSIPQLQQNIGLSPSLLLFVLLSIQLYYKKYPHNHENLPHLHTIGHFLTFSTLPFTKLPHITEPPHTLFQSALMCANYSNLPSATWNLSQATVQLANPSQLGYFVESGIICSNSFTTQDMKSNLLKNTTTYLVYSTKPYDHDTYNIPITFHSISHLALSLREQLTDLMLKQEQVEKNIVQYDLTLQVLYINAFSQVLHGIYKRVTSIVPQKQPNIVQYSTRNGAIPTWNTLILGSNIIRTNKILELSLNPMISGEAGNNALTRSPSLLLSQLAQYWSNAVSFQVKGYNMTFYTLFYNILTSLLSPSPALRITPILVTGGVGSGKTLFAQHFTDTCAFIKSQYFDLSSENLHNFHLKLLSTITSLQQYVTIPVKISPGATGCSVSQPLLYAIVMDNIDVLLLTKNSGDNGLQRVKYEILQLLLSIMHTKNYITQKNDEEITKYNQKTIQNEQKSTKIVFYPSILLLFTTHSLSSSVQSGSLGSIPSSPHQNQKLSQLQQNIIFQQFLGSFHYKLAFQTLSVQQRYEILKHYLSLISISYSTPYNIDSCTKNEETISSQNHHKLRQINENTPYTHCKYCSNVIYPTQSSQNTTICYDKDDVLMEWASTLHGCSPAVIQQLCSLAIVQSYKKHFPDETTPNSDKNIFTSHNDLCLSLEEWRYALNLVKLYHASPRQLIPTLHSQSLTPITSKNGVVIHVPSLQQSISPVFHRSWGGYLDQLLQLSILFQSSQNNTNFPQNLSNPTLKLSKSFINYNILLTGVSGTGKTHLIDLLSHVLKLKVIMIDIASLTSKYVGGSNALIANIFAQASLNKPCILLFENIDTFIINKKKMVFDSKTKVLKEITIAPYCTVLLETILKQLDQLALTREQNAKTGDNYNTSENDQLDTNTMLADPSLHGVFTAPQLPPFTGNVTAPSEHHTHQSPQKLTTGSLINDVIIVATTHLPLSQIPPTLTTSTRFLHTITLPPPTTIQKAQIFALQLSTKPFCRLKQYFDTNILEPGEKSDKTLKNISIQIGNHTPTVDSKLTGFYTQDITNTTENDALYDINGINKYFPTYQHVAMFIALFSKSQTYPGKIAEREHKDNGTDNSNAPQRHEYHVTAVTLSSIVDAAVVDALRDNIRSQKLQPGASHVLLRPLTPKNVISGLQAICTYDFSNLEQDIAVVETQLQHMSTLVKYKCQRQYKKTLVTQDMEALETIYMLQQQSTFSLPDIIEEFEYFHTK